MRVYSVVINAPSSADARGVEREREAHRRQENERVRAGERRARTLTRLSRLAYPRVEAPRRGRDVDNVAPEDVIESARGEQHLCGEEAKWHRSTHVQR